MSTEAPAIHARMRFDDPRKFLDFHAKQLGVGVVGLRHGSVVSEGTPVELTVSPPGVTDRIRCVGVTEQVTPRPDGSVRLRVRVEMDAASQSFLEAYLLGLRTGLEALIDDPSESDSNVGESMAADLGATLEELRTRASLTDAQTYHQTLGVTADANTESLQARFHALTRRYHPDLFFASTPDARKEAGRLFRRINEAYAVLKDPRRRKLYEAGLQGLPHTWTLRLTEEAEQTAQRQRRVRGGDTPTGQWHWGFARDLLQKAREEDAQIGPALRESAKMLRIALALEPGNTHFQHALEQVVFRLSVTDT